MIEQRFKDAIDRHVKDGCPTGHFINAVLENNLRDAIGRADENALVNLRDIVSYCYNEIPACSWGSKQNVKDWRKSKQVTSIQP